MSDDAWQSVGEAASNMVAKINTEKMDRARALRRNGVSYLRIVAATGLSMYVLKCEFEPGYKARVAESVKRGMEVRRKGRRKGQIHRTASTPLSPIGSAGNVPSMQAPAEVLADRDRRMAMAPRSLTAALLGDPPTPDWHKRP